jgi:hypothetical protein
MWKVKIDDYENGDYIDNEVFFDFSTVQERKLNATGKF